MQYAFYVAVFMLAALLQVSLIYAGVLPPVSAYSAGNLLFSLAGLALLSWTGWINHAGGVKKAAFKGAFMALAGFAVFFLGSIAGVYTKRPVLGVPLTSWQQLLALLAFTCALNTFLAAAVAGIAAFIAAKVKKKSG